MISFVLRSASLLALAFALPLGAQAVTLSNATVDVFVHRPGSGTVLAMVRGTLTATAAGEQISPFVDVPFQASGETLTLDSVDNLQINAALAANGTYTGSFFSYVVTPTTAVGVYDRTVNLSTHAGFRINSNLAGQPNVSSDYAIYVDAVPEPATVAALGLGAVAVLRRRKA